jgi:hypothetical protein
MARNRDDKLGAEGKDGTALVVVRLLLAVSRSEKDPLEALLRPGSGRDAAKQSFERCVPKPELEGIS